MVIACKYGISILVQFQSIEMLSNKLKSYFVELTLRCCNVVNT